MIILRILSSIVIGVAIIIKEVARGIGLFMILCLASIFSVFLAVLILWLSTMMVDLIKVPLTNILTALWLAIPTWVKTTTLIGVGILVALAVGEFNRQ